MNTSIGSFLVILDLIGTFAFALSGATAGIKYRLDLFGVLVLSFAAATAGGLMRDLVIGATPPTAFSDLRYLAIAVLAGIIMFILPRTVQRAQNLVAIFDAAGLALFAVTGTTKALAYNINPVSAALLGMLTGIGGGITRDILINEVPIVFTGELYAVAALSASSMVVIGHLLNWPIALVTVGAMLLCFVIRILAIWRHWQLPVASMESNHRTKGSPPSSE